MRAKISKYLGYFVFAFLLFVTACKDDSFAGGNNTNPDINDSKNLYYLAFRIYDAASIESRAGEDSDNPFIFDSDNEDYNKDQETFNAGLASEYAIYDGYYDAENSPHLLLILNDEGTKLEAILPIYNLDKEMNGPGGDQTTADVAYTTFFSKEEKSNIPEDLNTKTLLVVLNAGSDLQTAIKSALNKTFTDLPTALKSLYLSAITANSSNGDNGDKEPGEPYNPNFLFLSADNLKYFTMSSSMVVTNSGENGLSTFGPSIIKRKVQWYPSKEEAAQAPVFSFFLERLQAKITLSFKNKENKYLYFKQGDNDKGSADYLPQEHIVLDPTNIAANTLSFRYINSYTRSSSAAEAKNKNLNSKTTSNWKINITGWGMNAVEKEEYLFKNLSDPYIYNNGSSSSWWYSASLRAYRNYWAEGRHYTTVTSPDQYRETGLSTISSMENNGEASFPLKYFSFSNLGFRCIHEYSPEHTYDPSIFKTSEPETSKEYLRAGTHVIITAQLILGPSTSSSDDGYDGFDPAQIYEADSFDSNGLVISENEFRTTGVNSKFMMNDIIWSEDAYKEYVAEYIGYLMMDNNYKDLFGNDNDGILYVTFEGDSSEKRIAKSSDFEISSLHIPNGDNMVYVKRKNATTLFTKNSQDGTFKDVSSSYDEFVLTRKEYYAQHFNQGCMYYPIAVKHNDVNNVTKLGNNGVVRNHWYNFTVTKIAQLGMGVDDLNQPIIPNNLPKNPTLGIELSILPWHTIETDVDIEGQLPNINQNADDIDLDLGGKDWEYEGSNDIL